MSLREQLEAIIGPPLQDADPASEFGVNYIMEIRNCSHATAARIIRESVERGDFIHVGLRRMSNGKIGNHYRLSNGAEKKNGKARPALAPRPLAQPAQPVHDTRVPKKVRGKAK